MISSVLSRTNPAIATAVPVHALSSEMTTGMSAPPMGSVIRTPAISAANRTPQSATIPAWPVTNITPSAAAASRSRPLIMLAPRIAIGRPGTTPASFPEAIIRCG